MVPLTAGDTAELQGYFRVTDEYFAADHTSFWTASSTEWRRYDRTWRSETLDAELKDATAGDLLLMQGNLSIETTRHTLQTTRDRGLITYLNPSPIQWSYDGIWPLVQTVIANRDELAELTGRNDLNDGIRGMLSAGVETVLVTLGADGARLVCADRDLHVAATPTVATDTAGAGDTFCGAFIGATLRGHSPENALSAAVRAAAVTVSRRGTHSAFPSAAQILSILDELP